MLRDIFYVSGILAAICFAIIGTYSRTTIQSTAFYFFSGVAGVVFLGAAIISGREMLKLNRRRLQYYADRIQELTKEEFDIPRRDSDSLNLTMAGFIILLIGLAITFLEAIWYFIK